MKSAIDHKQFERTKAAPSRRVVPETKPAAAPATAAAPASNPPIQQPSNPLPKLAALLLILCVLCASAFVSRATTVTFSFTNDIAVPMTTMFYTNTSTGYVFYNATNTLNGTSNTLSTSFAVQGVAVQATNADLARLTPFTSLPALGSAVSLIISNTAAYSSGVPKNTTQFGTNIAAGAQYTSAVGTNAVSPNAYNTNLP